MTITQRLSRVFSAEGAGLAAVLIALIIFFTVKSPFFMTRKNIDSLLVAAVFIVLLAGGMTFVLIVRGIDLSVGSVLARSGATSLWSLMSCSPLCADIL